MYINDEVVEIHHPQENWHSGKHTILLYYPVENVVADYTNTFNVYMRVSGGIGFVDALRASYPRINTGIVKSLCNDTVNGRRVYRMVRSAETEKYMLII